jgi:protein phosphatase PTC1
MYAANVGDARIVASGGVELTQDHKPRGEIDRIRKHEGGFVLGDNHGRINGLLAVSRSIGDFYMHPYVVCTPYQSVTELTPDVKFAIVACDGIWDEISSKQATKIVADLVAAGKLTEACIKLRYEFFLFYRTFRNGYSCLVCLV